ncbi:Uncharacterised protein [Mycobacteroides abscessus subsp. abscessus]|nr:Uncharacterised protein [Mycobacteroides abscessus subsp. abscessus]
MPISNVPSATPSARSAISTSVVSNSRFGSFWAATDNNSGSRYGAMTSKQPIVRVPVNDPPNPCATERRSAADANNWRLATSNCRPAGVNVMPLA